MKWLTVVYLLFLWGFGNTGFANVATKSFPCPSSAFVRNYAYELTETKGFCTQNTYDCLVYIPKFKYALDHFWAYYVIFTPKSLDVLEEAQKLARRSEQVNPNAIYYPKQGFYCYYTPSMYPKRGVMLISRPFRSSI